MTNTTRIARAAACAILLAIPASAMGAEVTVRVEGENQTILPETRVAIPAPGLATITDTTDGDTQQVDAQSAAVAFNTALRAKGLGFGWTWSPFYNDALVDQIGAEKPPCDPPSYVPCFYFQLRANHKPVSVGMAGLPVTDGLQVLFAFTDAYAPPLAELDVTGPAAPLTPGQAFSVRVERYGASYEPGDPVPPADGVTVRYGSQTGTTTAAGTASFSAEEGGWRSVEASAPGAIRDAARVCTYPASDPTVCDLPALPPAQAPTETGLRVPVTITTASGPVTITVTIPVPRPGTAPLAIRRSMITGADLTPAELRRALGTIASAVAAQLNERASQGEDGVVLPSGIRWRATWLSGTPYVAPLRGNESFLGILRNGPRNGAAMRARAQSFGNHMRRCDISGGATAVTRHGYAMTLIRPASARAAVVQCASGGAPSGR